MRHKSTKIILIITCLSAVSCNRVRTFEQREGESANTTHSTAAAYGKGIYAAFFNEDGQLFAIGFADGSVSVHRSDSFTKVCGMQTNDGPVVSTLWEQNIIVAPNLHGSVHLVSQDRCNEVARVEPGFSVHHAALSRGGGYLGMCGQAEGVLIIDRTGANRRILLEHPASVHYFWFLPDSLVLTSCDNGMGYLWNYSDGEIRHRFEGHGDALRSIYHCPALNVVITSSRDMTVRLWNMETGKCISVFSDLNADTHVALTDNSGVYLASCDIDGRIAVRNLLTDQVEIVQAHEDAIVSLHFNPANNQLMSAGFDGFVRFWDVNPLLLRTELNVSAGD